MGELNETSSFLKIVEEEIESGEVKQKSRLQILNDLSIKWGAKDNVVFIIYGLIKLKSRERKFEKININYGQNKFAFKNKF